MPYDAITFLAAQQALSQRLADQAAYWPLAECGRAIIDALRTWNAYTSAQRATGVITMTTLEVWYALPTLLPSLRPSTITQYDLVQTLCDLLLEPAATTTWTGSEQFSLDDLIAAITRRRDQFLRETSVILTPVDVPVASPPASGRIPLPSDWLAVRRVAWASPEGLITPLPRDTEFSAGMFRPLWPGSAGAPPTSYSSMNTPPLQLQLLPPPNDTGTLQCLAVIAGADLNPATAVPLGVPNDWCWVVTWGALADLLSRDGLAYDPIRAAYAESRWQQGLQAAITAPVVLASRINNVPSQIVSVNDADRYAPLWQSVPGVPRQIITAGQTLIGAWPPPGVPIGGGEWSITLDVVRAMPIPTAAGDFLQISAADYDPILDYAQHLALVKCGPQQLQQSQPLLDRFLRYCGQTLSWQQAESPARRPTVDQTTQDTRGVPVTLPVAGDS